MIASFSRDEAYFRESLDEWIASVSTGRKFELGFLAIAFGVFEGWRYVSFKRRWLAERFASKQFGTAISFELAAGRVKQLTPALSASDTDTVMRVVASRRRYFVYPKSRAFVYLPHASITPPATREDVLRTLGAGSWTGFSGPATFARSVTC